MTPPKTKAMRVEENDHLEAVAPSANPNTGIGGNFPPLKEFFAELNVNLPAQLDADTKELIDRVTALLDAEGRMPTKIEDGDNETAAKVVAFQGQVQKCITSAEARREDLTEGPLAAQRIIMGHFRDKIYGPLGEPKSDKRTGQRGGLFDRISNTLTDYERRKVAIERAAREKAEREAREAAAAAQAARERAERAEREAAESERRRREEEERRIRAEEQERLSKIENQRQLNAEIARQAKAQKDREEREEQERAAAVRRAEESKALAEEAERKRMDAEAAAADADAKASTLSRTAGLHGSSSSLRENWKARITDAGEVDLVALKPFIKIEALEDAANRMAKIVKNTQKVKGVEFFDASRAAVRS